MKKGLFITFEGGEGCGKSTQIKKVAAWLKSEKLKVVVTKEPGSTALGKKIRGLVLDPKHAPVSSRTELFLYEADRAQHVETLIVPALKKGQIVLSDRFEDSSLVYQGVCRNLGLAWVKKLNTFATGGLEPDVVFIFDLPIEVAFKRMRGRPLDRLESEAKSFHQKVRRTFLRLAKSNKKKYVVVDASQSPEEVFRAVKKEIEKKL